MQPAPWLPQEPMRGRLVPLPRNFIIGFPYTRPQTDDCRLCLLPFLCAVWALPVRYGQRERVDVVLKAVNDRKGRCVVVIGTVASPVASCAVRAEGRHSEKELSNLCVCYV